MYVNPPPTTPARPRPVSGLATAVVTLAVAVLAEHLLRIVASWLVHQVLTAEPAGEFGTLLHRLDTPMQLLLVSNILLVPTLIAAVVTTSVWVHRARTNAGWLSPHLRFRYTPTSSVALLMVPLANLWFLRSILEDICAGSSPHGRDDRGARLVRAFWTTTIASAAVSVFGNVAFGVVAAQLYGSGRPADESLIATMAVGSQVFATLEHALLAACVVLFALVVRHITRRQSVPPGAAVPHRHVTPPQVWR